jgi:hypothetical protein
MELFLIALAASALLGFAVARKTEQMYVALCLGAVVGLLFGMILHAAGDDINDFESVGALVFAGMTGSSLSVLLPPIRAILAPIWRFKNFIRSLFQRRKGRQS